MKRAACWLTLGLALGIAGTAQAQADSGPVPLERVSNGELGGWIVVRGSAGGKAGRWLLDTGASRNLVAAHLARHLGLVPGAAVRAETPLGAVEGQAVDLPVIAVGGFERLGQTGVVIDLARVLGPATEELDGVLGVPWFEDQRADLDLSTWQGRFRNSPAAVEGRAAAAQCPGDLTPVPLSRHRGLPVLRIQHPTGTDGYVLDTGNPTGLIHLETEAADHTTPGIALPGGHHLTVAAELRLGPQQRSDVPVLRLSAPALRRALAPAARGLAGTAILEGARWVLDLSAQRLCVQPGTHRTPGGFGLQPRQDAAGLTVAVVLPLGPAAQAGVRVGEPIHTWAGLAPNSPLPELWRAVQGHELLTISVGVPARTLTLRRAVFAPPTY
jgi:hypothetical protein